MADVTEDPIHKQLANMSEIKFRIWIANKINRMEENLELEIRAAIQM